MFSATTKCKQKKRVERILPPFPDFLSPDLDQTQGFSSTKAMLLTLKIRKPIRNILYDLGPWHVLVP